MGGAGAPVCERRTPAEAILVDSEVGREDVLEFYGHLTSPDRVRILPFVLPPYLVRPTPDEVSSALRALRVSGRYLLFPAQFWPHKNHRRVTEAVAALHREGLDITVVMTGSADGNLRERVLAEVREVVASEGIGDLVRILGYVEDTTMAALYAGASGSSCPRSSARTNIPVIEAWSMGVPVLTSDIRGIRSSAATPRSSWIPSRRRRSRRGCVNCGQNDALRERLVVAGTERVRDNDPAAFRDELAAILRDVEQTIAPEYPGEPGMTGFETILDGATPLAYLIRHEATSAATEFFTSDDSTFQAGFVVYPAGGQVQAHLHLPVVRQVVGTSELLVVRSGRCIVDIYADDRRLVASRELTR